MKANSLGSFEKGPTQRRSNLDARVAAGFPSILLPEGTPYHPAGALVFYIDSGDKKIAHSEHPFLTFGGVACTLEFHLTLANNWMRMKTATFSQMQGPLTRNVI
jgi:hypothetical protein